MPHLVTESQIRRIYAETIDALYAYVSRRCGGVREIAEDVTQEAWLRAVRAWARDGIPDVPLAWLKTVARNHLLNDLRRREAISLDSMSADEVLSAIEHDEPNDSADVASLMTRALARLPAHEAGLLEEFHFERFKVAQLAEKYGISERAVEGRLRRARERLRGELEITLKEHGGIP
jgi:RNA polymerase sigma factor (sigma-70 family)